MIIAYENAQLTYAKALAPKKLHTIDIATHGYCKEMAEYLDTELDAMVS